MKEFKVEQLLLQDGSKNEEGKHWEDSQYNDEGHHEDYINLVEILVMEVKQIVNSLSKEDVTKRRKMLQRSHSIVE